MWWRWGWSSTQRWDSGSGRGHNLHNCCENYRRTIPTTPCPLALPHLKIKRKNLCVSGPPDSRAAQGGVFWTEVSPRWAICTFSLFSLIFLFFSPFIFPYNLQGQRQTPLGAELISLRSVSRGGSGGQWANHLKIETKKNPSRPVVRQ